MKIEEQSKVKAMIDGINASNQKNIETFEDQINQARFQKKNFKKKFQKKNFKNLKTVSSEMLQ